MSFESFKARMRASGVSPVDSGNISAKHANASMILNSPSRKEVLLNDDVTPLYCLVSDRDGFKKREFLFMPDTTVFNGDYLTYDSHKYMVTSHNLDSLIPKAEAMLCNFDFPIKTITEQKIVGINPSTNRPKYETVTTVVTKPCVVTVKSYASLDNSSIGHADVNVVVYLPYSDNYDDLPKINDSIMIENSQYKIIENTFQNVDTLYGIKRGYVETRLQWEARTT